VMGGGEWWTVGGFFWTKLGAKAASILGFSEARTINDLPSRFLACLWVLAGSEAKRRVIGPCAICRGKQVERE
jgi:hypothetical protein